MPSLLQALLVVTTGIEAALDDATIDVADHPGQFTEAELTRLVRKKRAVRVAIETMPEMAISGPGQLRASLQFSAAIVCADTLTAPRHLAALAITQDILEILPHNRWGVRYLGPALPKSIRADNLYSGAIDSQGLSLWSISWQQTFTNQ